MTSSRKNCLSKDKPCQPSSHREALHCQGSHDPDITVHQMAEIMDIDPSTLYGWLDPNRSGHIPDERLEHLLRLTDKRSVYVRYLAGLQGTYVYTVSEKANGG